MKRSWKSTKIYFAAIYVLEILIIGLHAWSENEIDGSDFDSHPFNHKSPASELPHEVDIVKLINITAKDPGVSLVQGPIKNFPAYKFRLPYGNVPVANSSAVTSAMSRPSGFTVIFLFRQQKNNLGTLISVNSPGRLTPWFQINSNLRTGILTLKYKMNASSKLHQVDWPLPGHHRKTPLAAWTWLSLSADYYSGTLRLDLDCLPSKFHQLAPKTENAFISIPGDSLVYFRQEPGRKKKFLGSVQVAKVLPYVTQHRLWSCLEISDNLSPEHVKPLV